MPPCNLWGRKFGSPRRRNRSHPESCRDTKAAIRFDNRWKKETKQRKKNKSYI